MAVLGVRSARFRFRGLRGTGSPSPFFGARQIARFPLHLSQQRLLTVQAIRSGFPRAGRWSLSRVISENLMVFGSGVGWQSMLTPEAMWDGVATWPIFNILGHPRLRSLPFNYLPFHALPHVPTESGFNQQQVLFFILLPRVPRIPAPGRL